MAIERQTIDVRVEQLASSKTITKSSKQLEAQVNWINSEKQRLKLAQSDLKLSNERLSFDQVQEKLRRARLTLLQTFAWTNFNRWMMLQVNVTFCSLCFRLKFSQNQGVINVDKHPAYPNVIDDIIAVQALLKTTELRPFKYLNNMVEKDQRFIKRLLNPGMAFGSLGPASRVP